MSESHPTSRAGRGVRCSAAVRRRQQPGPGNALATGAGGETTNENDLSKTTCQRRCHPSTCPMLPCLWRMTPHHTFMTPLQGGDASHEGFGAGQSFAREAKSISDTYQRINAQRIFGTCHALKVVFSRHISRRGQRQC